MAASAPHTILLRGRGIREEAPAGGAITPGHLVMMNASDQLVVHATAAGNTPKLIAVENDVYTGVNPAPTIDTAYASGDYVQAEYPPPGAIVYLLVAAAATAILKGGLLESAGNGTVRVLGAGVALFKAREAIDNSGGGSSVRIRATVL